MSSSNDTSKSTPEDGDPKDTSKNIGSEQIESEQVENSAPYGQDSFERTLEKARSLKAENIESDIDITEEKIEASSTDHQLIGLEDLPTEIEEHWNPISTETETLEIDEAYTTSLASPSFIEETNTDLEEWGQLHPYSLLINLIPQMWRTLQNAWPLLLFIVVGGNQAHQVIDSIFVLFFVALSVIRTLIHFFNPQISCTRWKVDFKDGSRFSTSKNLGPRPNPKHGNHTKPTAQIL